MDEGLSHIWAKSPRDGTPAVTLVQHTEAVLGRLVELRGRLPRLPDQCSEPLLWGWAFWACCLHDFGKAARGFQSMLRGGQRWGHRHEVLSLSFAVALFPDEQELTWIAAGIASHHKDARPLRRLYPADMAEDWNSAELAAEIDAEDWRRLLDWAVSRGGEIARTAGMPHLISGSPLLKERSHGPADIERLTILGLIIYHRLNRSLVPGGALSQIGMVVRGLVTQADHLASAGARPLESTGIPGPDQWSNSREIPRDKRYHHQSVAAAHDGDLLLSAPTGSGKTEAALLWAYRQQTAFPAPLCYLLPYQASLNAMNQRLRGTLNRDTALIHARSLDSIYRALLDGGDAPDEALRKARAAQALARLGVPSIRLTTPFQVLKAAYRLRGYEALWTNLAGNSLVVDEIHAYDPRKLGLLLGMLRELHRKWGVRICVMTATLPGWLRVILEDVLQTGLVRADDDFYRTFSRHRIQVSDGGILSPYVIHRILDEFRSGVRVLVVANTVASAQAVYTQLAQSLPPDRRLLLHSRFTAADRVERERRLLQASGSDGGFVAVGTQAVEVSLDIDFGSLWTEPAPIEALIQRFGRINRRGRRGIATVHILTESTRDSLVYDPRLKRRSLEILLANNEQVIDESLLSRWIDQVYEDGIGAEYARLCRHSMSEFDASCLGRLIPFDTDDGMETAFSKLFDGDEAVPIEFLDEYRRRLSESPIAARQLLVPLRSHALNRVARWDPDARVWVAHCSYCSEFGLQLYRAPDELHENEESA